MGLKCLIWLVAPSFSLGLTLKIIMADNWKYPPGELPEPYTFVLATIETEHDRWVEIVGFDGIEFQLPGRGKTHLVIAWMEIPKPAAKPDLQSIKTV